MKGFRRVLSIIFYLFAGMFLMSWAAMAFVSDQPDLGKAEVMGVMAAFALVPLALGAVASPGRRGREIGIVLVVAAAWVGVSAITMIILLMDPEFLALMPPDTFESMAMFGDPGFGAGFTIAMGTTGLWLVRRKSAPTDGRREA